MNKKKSVVVVYTGDGKGKTSAAIGMVARALGAGQRVVFIQFIKNWEVSEHKFFDKYLANESKFTFYKGGKGFYHAGNQSAKGVSDDEHIASAQATLEFAHQATTSGDFDLVVCDEINNAVHDGLVSAEALKTLICKRAEQTSICLTGRNFPSELEEYVDIITNMTKIKHHYDDGYLAQEGIDY
ncbi:cob(I)yrinic acid a,c-diamide adenosyltransferase [Candidatus Saccharibacteria bacterium]|nr:cob(I)yrinic acid a,c-diamide adenosyltransferase [Candidatus Saccharibacteria bacterium]